MASYSEILCLDVSILAAGYYFILIGVVPIHAIYFAHMRRDRA